MNIWTTLSFFSIFLICSSFAKPRPSDIVNINQMIDESLPDIRQAIRRFGFDPMKLPNVTDYVSPATVNLTNGVIRGARFMRRAGDFSLIFLPNTIRLDAKVKFPELRARFNYSMEALYFYSDDGFLNATIKNATARMRIDFNIATLTVSNPKFKIEGYDDVSVSMTSNYSYAAVNFLKNIIVNVLIPRYEKNILEMSEKTALIVAHDVMKYTNKNLPQWIAELLARGPNQLIDAFFHDLEHLPTNINNASKNKRVTG